MNEPNENSIAMGLRIQQMRKAAKLTQMQLSEKINVSTQYISDLERGKVGCSISTLIKLCDTLAVSSDFILRGKEPRVPDSFNHPGRFDDLPPQEKALMEEGFNLLKKALSIK